MFVAHSEGITQDRLGLDILLDTIGIRISAGPRPLKATERWFRLIMKGLIHGDSARANVSGNLIRSL
jgi:hypothetical protein